MINVVLYQIENIFQNNSQYKRVVILALVFYKMNKKQMYEKTLYLCFL